MPSGATKSTSPKATPRANAHSIPHALFLAACRPAAICRLPSAVLCTAPVRMRRLPLHCCCATCLQPSAHRNAPGVDTNHQPNYLPANDDFDAEPYGSLLLRPYHHIAVPHRASWLPFRRGNTVSACTPSVLVAGQGSCLCREEIMGELTPPCELAG